MKNQNQFYFNQSAANGFKTDAEGLCKHLNNLNIEFKQLGYGEIKESSSIIPAIIGTHYYIAEHALKNAGLKSGNFELSTAFNVVKKPQNYDKIMQISELGFLLNRYQGCANFVVYKSGSWVLSGTFTKDTEPMFWVNYRSEKQKAKIEAVQSMVEAFNRYCAVDNQFVHEEWASLKFYVNNDGQKFVLDNEAATGI